MSRSSNTFTWLSVIERLHVEDSCTWLWDDFTNYFFHYRSYLYVTPKRVDHLVRKSRWGRGNLISNTILISLSWFLQITWSQPFSEIVSESAANQPSILHKYHWSTLWASPSNLHLRVEIILFYYSLKPKPSWCRGNLSSRIDNLNSGFLSKTIERPRCMDMSVLNSFLTLFVCI